MAGARCGSIELVCEYLDEVQSPVRKEVLMAVKIVHVRRPQEVRFGDRATAEHYAAKHGGLVVWKVLPVPRGELVRRSAQ